MSLKVWMFGIRLVLGLMTATSALAQDATAADVERKLVRGTITSYEARDGTVYRVGDDVFIGATTSTWLQNAGISTYPVSPAGAASRVSIKGLSVRGKVVVVHTTVMPGGVFPLMNVNLEGAIALGEIRLAASAEATLQASKSASAVEELRRAKELYDLGILTSEEYEAKKKVLTPIILGGDSVR
jgi:hypothetical protein